MDAAQQWRQKETKVTLFGLEVLQRATPNTSVTYSIAVQYIICDIVLCKPSPCNGSSFKEKNEVALFGLEVLQRAALVVASCQVLCEPWVLCIGSSIVVIQCEWKNVGEKVGKLDGELIRMENR
jgi:hypothetical protein